MDATELFTLTTTLKVVLWIEFIVYMGIGVYEILDSFGDAKPWVKRNGRLQNACFCMFLVGFCCVEWNSGRSRNKI